MKSNFNKKIKSRRLQFINTLLTRSLMLLSNPTALLNKSIYGDRPSNGNCRILEDWVIDAPNPHNNKKIARKRRVI